MGLAWDKALSVGSGMPAAQHRVLHAEPGFYCAHPHLVAADRATWLLVFNRAGQRAAILHPPQDPAYQNLLMRSDDQGASWSDPVPVPDGSWAGVECAGLTALRRGRILLNQWRFHWYPWPPQEEPRDPLLRTPAQLLAGLRRSFDIGDWAGDRAKVQADPGGLLPCGRGGGETWVHLSDDGGRSFAVSRPIDTAPYSGGYGMRGALELPDGEILLPLSDVPHYRRVFALRSRDGGESWSAAQSIAEQPEREFEEPAGVLLPGGRLLLLLRENRSRSLFRVVSDDGGRSWSAPTPTGIGDYPAELLSLADGRLLCVAGRRRPPFGILLHVSEDGGETWGARRLRVLPNRDLGYPSMARRDDGGLLVVYYGQDDAGTTGIHASTLGPTAVAAL